MRRTCSRWRRPTIRSQSRDSVLTVRTNRSAYAFACGARTGVWITLIPSLRIVETSGEFAVAIVDQEAHPFEEAGEAEVARLLNDPGSCRVRRAAGEVDAPAFEFDEEEHVEAVQRDGLDGEEVAGEHARGLPAQEQPPAQRSAPGSGLEPSRGKQALDRTR